MDEPTRVIGGFPMIEEDRGAALFRDQVATLKQHILSVVRSEVAEFRKSTGIAPTDIRIAMVDVASMGDPIERIVGGVDIHFEM